MLLHWSAFDNGDGGGGYSVSASWSLIFATSTLSDRRCVVEKHASRPCYATRWNMTTRLVVALATNKNCKSRSRKHSTLLRTASTCIAYLVVSISRAYLIGRDEGSGVVTRSGTLAALAEQLEKANIKQARASRPKPACWIERAKDFNQAGNLLRIIGHQHRHRPNWMCSLWPDFGRQHEARLVAEWAINCWHISSYGRQPMLRKTCRFETSFWWGIVWISRRCGLFVVGFLVLTLFIVELHCLLYSECSWQSFCLLRHWFEDEPDSKVKARVPHSCERLNLNPTNAASAACFIDSSSNSCGTCVNVEWVFAQVRACVCFHSRIYIHKNAQLKRLQTAQPCTKHRLRISPAFRICARLTLSVCVFVYFKWK